ncbi:putative Uncharacterized transposase-like protein [Monocercomonoides exilis]|uniref:putative Uncharacterized transposase-like protein n=1 Tax=Monocercomonoides exilis TaxID=2049356 RepID=UPI00355955EB|nr:putative Uncharacterized transposase-like protein [Monocercomonoides exilis]|eukprot:MONOS_13533.1-p1 / transcript=MONOS_13533.1 / gene=MONOS_13533 / organism=Monocercomonoides_exilis_PA203 / gene_product=Uncharacterized transposase-like protein HI1328.1 / transcript_product=Uncharacterized transposase-like protein HI1328.1 / location=Mono_scaffold00841:12575-13126(+) / protein_length=183 / sequence_SO=supercontig / SO=protein_coding / is_pseudo=false
MIERKHDGKKGKCLIVRVKNRKKETLIPIIENNTIPGSTIYSDEWKAYSSLSSLGYDHHTVCHKYNFVDPESGICTNLIESTWSSFRKSLPRNGIKEKYIDDFVTSFVGKRSETLEFEDFIQKLLVYKPLNVEKEIDESEKDETEESDESDVPVLNENDEETEDESDSLGAGDGADASEFELR